jgi:hypothetical protein
MLYNEKDSWTYSELSQKTLVEKGRLDSALLMLCNPRMKLLEKQLNKPSFDNPDETVKLNLKWTSQNILVKLVPVGAAKKKDGSESNAE